VNRLRSPSPSTRVQFPNPSCYVENDAYDAVGNLTSKTDRKNQQIAYTYDQLNRLTVTAYPDTTTVNYTYDNDSRLTQVSSNWSMQHYPIR
jgi:YD repeat-containing protein